jgi:hypothetical protein
MRARTSLLVTGSALTTATMKSAWRWVLDGAATGADNWGRLRPAGAPCAAAPSGRGGQARGPQQWHEVSW